MTDLAIGDPIEAARPVERDGKFVSEWWPGTICALSDDEVGVAFADGSRHAYSRWGDHAHVMRSPSWRRA